MTSKHHPCRDNLSALRQGVDLIRSLDDRLYSKPAGKSNTSGVGSQFRHGLDFYTCFLQGLPTGRIDYDARKRDARIEIDREYAAGQFERVIDALAALTPEQLEGELLVKLECPEGGAEEDWCASSAKRELQFLLSHTVHHHALIVTLLRLHGHELGPDQRDFGVSPSTLSHWRATGTRTG